MLHVFYKRLKTEVVTCKRLHLQSVINAENQRQHVGNIPLTVCISVDSALATRTNTSASTQNLSIQLSMSGETSMPGLHTVTATISSSHPFNSYYWPSLGYHAILQNVACLYVNFPFTSINSRTEVYTNFKYGGNIPLVRVIFVQSLGRKIKVTHTPSEFSHW